jgi:hypothetical protein
MGYSIELYFERRFEENLRSLWDMLERTGVPSILKRIGSRPHLSLMVFDDCNVDHVACLLDIGIKGLCKFPIIFPAFSIIPGNQHSVLLTPTINQGLIDIQKSLYDLLAKNGYSTRKHYKPHNWYPHCSISKELSPTEAQKTIEICINYATIRETLVTDIGFIEFRPRKVIKTIGLVDGNN